MVQRDFSQTCLELPQTHIANYSRIKTTFGGVHNPTPRCLLGVGCELLQMLCQYESSCQYVYDEVQGMFAKNHVVPL